MSEGALATANKSKKWQMQRGNSLNGVQARLSFGILGPSDVIGNSIANNQFYFPVEENEIVNEFYYESVV